MAIDWTLGQRKQVVAHLDAHHVQSGRCLEAARGVLPIAQARDEGARPWKLIPGEGRFVVPKHPLARKWWHHYTVEAVDHYVDALAGADGTNRANYSEQHWQCADRILWQAVDLDQEER